MIAPSTVTEPIPIGESPGSRVRVVIADDHRLTRRAVERVLTAHPRIDVVGVASNGVEARDLSAELRPDVVLLDVQMPVMGGFEAAQAIRAKLTVRIVLMSSHGESAYREAADDLSARFVDKSAPDADLVAAVLGEPEPRRG